MAAAPASTMGQAAEEPTAPVLQPDPFPDPPSAAPVGNEKLFRRFTIFQI
jgi:hypothetical protein